MKKLQFAVAIAALVVTVGTSAFSKHNTMAAAKYSLSQQATVTEPLGQAYKLGVNVTSLTEGSGYTCNTSSNICTIHFDDTKIHTDPSGFKYVYVADAPTTDPGTFTQP
jgi:hypothetical protein